MTRDELIGDIGEEIKKVIPENKDLDADDVDCIETACEEVVNNASEALEENEDAEDAETDEVTTAGDSQK